MVEGGQVVSAAFIGVGKQTFNISDLKVTGWEADESFLWSPYACDIYILTPGGATATGKGQYFTYVADWVDELNDGEGGHAPGVWYDYLSQPIIAGGENDFAMKPGQGLFFITPGGDGEHLPRLVSAGEVIQNTVQKELVEGGNCVGSPMAAPVSITTLSVTGWEEDESFLWSPYACDVYILTPGGATATGKNQYFTYVADWIDELNDGEGGHAPGVWYDYLSQVIVPDDENDFKLTPSQGLFFIVPGGDGEHLPTLIFDSIFPQPTK